MVNLLHATFADLIKLGTSLTKHIDTGFLCPANSELFFYSNKKRSGTKWEK